MDGKDSQERGRRHWVSASRQTGRQVGTWGMPIPSWGHSEKTFAQTKRCRARPQLPSLSCVVAAVGKEGDDEDKRACSSSCVLWPFTSPSFTSMMSKQLFSFSWRPCMPNRSEYSLSAAPAAASIKSSYCCRAMRSWSASVNLIPARKSV